MLPSQRVEKVTICCCALVVEGQRAKILQLKCSELIRMSISIKLNNSTIMSLHLFWDAKLILTKLVNFYKCTRII